MTAPEANRRLKAAVDRAVRRALVRELALLAVTAAAMFAGVSALERFAPAALVWIKWLLLVAAVPLLVYVGWAVVGYVRVVAREDDWDDWDRADPSDAESRQGGGGGER